MKSDEFLKEVKESSICPENFEEIYAEFQQFQADAIETLKEVHRVCEKNLIPYQLAFGSLLGFVRDGGQIPWDYDIDIFVPHEERANLVEALKRDLNEKFYFYCPEVSKKCRHMIMRVAPVGYRSEALHVDVFFLVGTPEDKAERVAYAQEIRKVSCLRFGKLVNVWEENLGNKINALKMLVRRKLPAAFVSLKAIERKYDKLCSMYSLNESTYCVSSDVIAPTIEIPTENIKETKLAECDFGIMRIPVRYEEILKEMYGDYTKVPPLENRIKEVLSFYKRIKIYQSYKK